MRERPRFARRGSQEGVLRRFAAIAAAALLTSAASRALDAPATPVLDAVAQAIGGKDRVLAVRTLILEGTGEKLYFGQTHTPYAKTNVTVTAFRRSYDFANRRWLLDETRESRYQTPAPPPVRVRIGLDGDVGYNVVGDGDMARVSATAPFDRSAELLNQPVGFVQAAYAAGNTVTEDRDGDTRRIRLRVGAIDYTMHVDGRTNLPIRISRLVDHPMLGDVELEVELSDWRDADGLKLPMRVMQREDRWVLSDYRITSARVNADPGNLVATDAVRAATLDTPGGGQGMTVAVQELASGVWLLDGPAFNGGLYHTVAIEQADRIVLIEAPDNDARTLAILAKARDLRPGKPLGPLVSTHAHFDHAGGLRAAMSQGLTIVTQEGNKDFYERVYAGHHTNPPDALAKNPQPLRLSTIGEKLVLSDPRRPIELYAVEGSPHAGAMLVAYLPKERILIQADLDTEPGPNGPDPAHPFTPALLDVVERYGLRVDLVVGIHGNPIPWPKPAARTDGDSGKKPAG